jgi:hypothetical protein
MSGTAIATFLDRKPFVPFCIELSDGSTYDINGPDLALLGETAIDLRARDGKGYKWRATVALLHVVKVMELPETKAMNRQPNTKVGA